MSLVDIVLFLTISFIALAILNGLALDWAGMTINPWVVLLATLVEVLSIALCIHRRGIVRIHRDYAELAVFVALVIFVTGYLIYPSLPGLIPPSRHFDAANHVVLATYIYNHNALPHDFNREVDPYFMSGYPAGGALFGALVSHWLGSVPFTTLHPLISFILALTAGLIFRTVRELLPTGEESLPIAVLSTLLLFTAWEYFPGTVNERYFYGQVYSQFFALCAFFFACFYDEIPDWLSIGLMSLSMGLVWVSHPTAIVAAGVVAGGTVLLRAGQPWRTRLLHVLGLGVGFLLVFLIYVAAHLVHWTELTGYGEAAQFSIETIGLFIPVLGTLGTILALIRRWRDRYWIPLLLTSGVLAQPFSLVVISWFVPGIVSYFFDRSVYLLIYPLAVLSSIPLYLLVQFITSRLPRVNPRLAWGIAPLAVMAILVWLPPRPFAPVTAPEVKAAYWAKQHLDVDNIGVISPIREDAYWIEWAILGHPPSSLITANAYNLGSMTYEEWRANPSRPDFAIVRNTARVPSDPAVKTVYQVDNAAILEKPRGTAEPEPVPTRRLTARFDQMLDLVGYDVRGTWTPNSASSLVLYWRPLEIPPDRIGAYVQLLDRDGNVVARQEQDLMRNQFPTQRWPIGKVVTDDWTLALDRSVLPDTYSIELAVFFRSGARLSVKSDDPNETQEAVLGPFRVTIPKPSTEQLRAAPRLNAQFGSLFELYGASVDPAIAHPGDAVYVDLFWESKQVTDRDYTVFVHLLDSAGRVIAQHDAQPQNGTRPTSSWREGETLQDPYRIFIPKDAPPGNYQIEVGMYSPSDLVRLAVENDNRILLRQTVTIR